MGPVWEPFFKVFLSLDVNKNKTKKNTHHCNRRRILFGKTFFFCYAIRIIDYRQPSQIPRHMEKSADLAHRWFNGMAFECLEEAKQSRVSQTWIFFSNSLNKSCNDVNYYKFHCIMHTDHPVWHWSQPLNLNSFFFVYLARHCIWKRQFSSGLVRFS